MKNKPHPRRKQNFKACIFYKQRWGGGGSPRLQYFIDYFTEMLALSAKLFRDAHKDPRTGAVQEDRLAESSLRTAIGVAAHRDEAFKRAHATLPSSNEGSGLIRRFLQQLRQSLQKKTRMMSRKLFLTQTSLFLKKTSCYLELRQLFVRSTKLDVSSSSTAAKQCDAVPS